MSVCQELQELYPAYALDAITNDERSRIEAHLVRCANCAQQVAEYQSVADALALAVPPIEPPAGLKARVLAATTPRPVPSSNLLAQLHIALTNLVRAPAFAVAMLVLVVALAVWNWSLQNQLDAQIVHEMSEQRAFLNTVAYAESAPRRMEATSIAPHAVGRLYVAPELNTLALVVYDLPTLDAHRVYQMWLIRADGTRTSGGTFTVDHEGTGWLMVHPREPVSDCQSVGITIEPRGGSPKPTGERVLGTTLRD